MVMRNRHDGADAAGWWDDLPPAVRRRFSAPLPPDHDPADFHPTLTPTDAPPSCRPGVVADLSRLAGLFLAVALGNLLFLLVALSFLTGRIPLGN